jgi:7,8-dihydroneopterin aldolase/epimerase/oxygenase
MAAQTPTASARGQVALRGITGFGRHGVFDFEREQGQPFVVDVVCTVDLDQAAATDDLTWTVDYGVLAQAVVADIEGTPLNLIEALADRIARTCLRSSLVQAVQVTVHKPQAPISVTVADVAVTLTRCRASLTPASPEPSPTDRSAPADMSNPPDPSPADLSDTAPSSKGGEI